MELRITETKDLKIVKSEKYNSVFDKNTGFFIRYGETKEDDPQVAPMPEILDLEISAGKCMGQCAECYKQGNGAVEEAHNMIFDEFRKIFHKVAKTVIEIKFKDHRPPEFSFISDDLILYKNCKTKQDIINIEMEYFNPDEVEYCRIYNQGLLQQIAFGICDIGSNPDFFKMMEYCREFDVIPNYTCHALDMTEEYAKKTAELCGAVAISVYNKEKSYNAVKMLADNGMKQINFHAIAHDKSYNKILSIIDDIKTDKRLIGNINAVVLLKYKPKGNGVGKFHHLSDEQYRNIIKYAEEKQVGIGFDSCSAHAYLRIIKDDKDFEVKSKYADPCESSCFSSYINHKGEFYACSFCENEGMWKEGLDVLHCQDFEAQIWNNTKTQQFRQILLNNCRKCPMFNLDNEDE